MYFSKRPKFATLSFFALFGFNFSHDIYLFSLTKYVLKNRILKARFNPQLTILNQVGNLANQNKVTMASHLVWLSSNVNFEIFVAASYLISKTYICTGHTFHNSL